MKPSLALIAAAGLAALLAGCGQPGPLYMPKPPAKPAPATATPAPSAPSIPATAGESRDQPVSSSPAPTQQ